MTKNEIGSSLLHTPKEATRRQTPREGASSSFGILHVHRINLQLNGAQGKERDETGKEKNRK